MEKRVEHLVYDVAFDPSGDEDFFYASAAKALVVKTHAAQALWAPSS